ncbi:hypothetical protein RN001_002151 [Aquatica leii]|uniref:Uncharacterized protein n=1 Tax=Aquatica leii TaxID=1421715 RepID=A0AAN7PD07_9COLE|nr:hypothetical protein RN001_002151 [Aquatica leii]
MPLTELQVVQLDVPKPKINIISVQVISSGDCQPLSTSSFAVELVLSTSPPSVSCVEIPTSPPHYQSLIKISYQR